mmetsp:Transcript_12885/g.22156  ORF Transcript_12885/g.22156 Transcript_12885/m.22156 type:complete len:219 (-) Transcript_12885:461-1117(-)
MLHSSSRLHKRGTRLFDSADAIFLLLALALLLLPRGSRLLVPAVGDRGTILFLGLSLRLFLRLGCLRLQCRLHRRIFLRLASERLGVGGCLGFRRGLGLGLGFFLLALERAYAVAFLVGCGALHGVVGALALGGRLDAPKFNVVVGFAVRVVGFEGYLFVLIGGGGGSRGCGATLLLRLLLLLLFGSFGSLRFRLGSGLGFRFGDRCLFGRNLLLALL